MSIINKTRLTHLGNTSCFTAKTTLSPKFWAKCAAVVSSLAVMDDASAATINVTGSDTATINTKLSSSNPLTKTGSGTLVLGCNNTTSTAEAPLTNPFTGATNLNDGTIAIAETGALGTGTLTMANGTTLQAYAAGKTVANAIQLGATGGAVSGAYILTNDAGDTHPTLTLSGSISEGTAGNSMTVQGHGTLVLSGSNSYTGVTALNNTATLKISNAHALSNSNRIMLVNDTTLQDSTSASINALTLTGAATINVDSGQTLTALGAVTGTHTLTKMGTTGTLVLSGTNSSQSTNLTISEGTVSVASDANIPGGTLRLSGGKLHASASYTSTKALEITNASSIGAASGQTLTYSGVIADDSGNTLTLDSGTVALGGDYSGCPTKLNVANNAILLIGDPTNLTYETLTLDGGTLNTTASFDVSQAVHLNSSSTLSTDSGTTLTASGLISGAHTLTKTSAGMLVLENASNYAQTNTNLTISAGTVSVASDANIPGGTLTLGDGKLLASVGYTSGKAITMGGDGSIGAASGQTLTYNGTITDAVLPTNLTISDGTVALAADYSGNTHTNLIVANGATLRINAAEKLTGGLLRLANGTLNTTATFASSKAIALDNDSHLDVTVNTTLTASGAITGAHTLTKNTGTGTLILAGVNSTSATTNLTITTGTVSVASDANIPGGTLSLNGGKLLTGTTTSHKNFTMVENSYIGSSGTLTYSGTITDAASPKTLFVSDGVVVLDQDNSGKTHTNLMVYNNATISIDAANRLTGGALILENGTLNTTATFASDKAITLSNDGYLDVKNGTTLTASGVISGGYTLTKNTGAGTLVLAGTNSGSSTHLTISAGTVSIDAADKLPHGILTLNGGSTLLSTAGSAVTLTSPSNVVIGGNATLDVGSNAMTLNKVVSGSGVLTKAGSSTLTLGVSNTHTGGITVSNGSLALADNHAAGTGTITLGADTILSGNSDGATFANAIALDGSATLQAADNFTASGVISGANKDLTVTGTNKTVTLSGASTYSGTTTLAGSVTVSLASSNNLHDTSAMIMGDGTTLKLGDGVAPRFGFSFVEIG
jgi:fibronectin-binding autotransporter adhesin